MFSTLPGGRVAVLALALVCVAGFLSIALSDLSLSLEVYPFTATHKYCFLFSFFFHDIDLLLWLDLMEALGRPCLSDKCLCNEDIKSSHVRCYALFLVSAFLAALVC